MSKSPQAKTIHHGGAYLVYSSYIAALGEKLRRARQGMLPCQALRSFSFLPFQSTGIPDLHSMA